MQVHQHFYTKTRTADHVLAKAWNLNQTRDCYSWAQLKNVVTEGAPWLVEFKILDIKLDS